MEGREGRRKEQRKHLLLRGIRSKIGTGNEKGWIILGDGLLCPD